MTAIIILALLGSAIVAGLVYERRRNAIDRQRFAPPGELVEADGARLHVRVLGTRRSSTDPVLVLDGGLTANSISWFKVAGQLACRHCVVIFDRAGHLWSEAGRGPRDARANNRELRAALRAVDLAPPFLYVAHSYSGLLARTFAARFPAETAGLVLLDTTTSDLAMRMRGYVIRTLLPLWTTLARVGVLRLLAQLKGSTEPSEWPPSLQAWSALSKSGKDFAATSSELWTFPMNARLADAAPLPADLPLVVFASSSTYGTALPVPHGMTAAQANESNVAGQRALAASSRHSMFRLLEDCGHEIPWERPELVIEAVDEALRLRARLSGAAEAS